MADGTAAVADTGATGTVATTAATTATTTATTAAAQPWFGGFDTELQGYVQNKGWNAETKAADIIKSFRETERLVGLDKLPMPKDLNDKDGYSRVYDRLGRPKSAADYGLKPADGGDPAFATTMAEVFHGLGLNKSQVDGIVGKYGEHAAAATAAANAEFARNSAAELDATRKEWGPSADQNFAAAQRATLQFGIDQPTMEKIERAIGTKAMLGLFSKIGGGLSEDRGAGVGNAAGFMTPEAAQAKLNDLKADQGWTKRYLDGGQVERAEYDKLITIVAGG